ncbi:MAG: short chain dehydrogenase [Rhodospirillales bacterium CG15_BIG_FIL_POST_REV_8_21_14_020_66_15]|nr:MAG: short chain dehydrogenase [Rhodospirillales bacterium CG15_BIG_FIL_POST_REV_8_21_14_020_66_15]
MTENDPITRSETALVTGAGRRIGRALALDLAARGWRVAVHCHTSRADAEAVVAEIAAAGGEAAVVQADLADEDATAALIPAAAEALGPVTLLVNNASLFENDMPDTVTRESWNAHMAVNLRAPFVLIQAFVRHLGAGQCGNVVNIVDQRVLNLRGDFTSYTLSKYGLWGLTQMLARTLAPAVRVNAIGPGPTLPSPRQTDEQFVRQWRSTPLERPVDPREICRALRFILDAPALTGQIIALDSGQHMGAAWDNGPALE